MLLKNLQERNNEASTAKIAIWYTLSNVFSQGLAFLSTPIFTRFLTKTEYGQFSNFASWVNILTIIITLDFSTSIARAKYDFNDRMNEYLSSVLLAGNIVTIICYFIIEINIGLFEHLLSMETLYIRFLFMYLLFYPTFTYIQIKHRIYKKYFFFVLLSVLSAIIQTLISIFLVLIMNNKLLGRVCGFVVPVTMLNALLWIYIVAKGKKLSLDCVRFACKISIPLIPHSLSGVLLGNSDRVMITQFCGSNQTALYSLAYQISLIAGLIWNSMNQAWSPWLFDNLNENKRDLIRKNAKIYFSIFAVLVVGIILISPDIILFLGGNDYYEARFAMPPIILSAVFQFAYGMYVNLEIYDKKTFVISIGTMAAAALNIGLNELFIPRYGYIAAAYTTLLGYSALYLFHFLIVKKATDLVDTYSAKFNFFVLLFFCILGAGSLVLYTFNWIRYLAVVIYVFLILFFVMRNRDYLLGLIRNNEREK